MPRQRTIDKARRDKREGQNRPRRRRANSCTRRPSWRAWRALAKQAIAIGRSEARRAGVDLPPPKRGQVTDRTRKSAEYAYEGA